MRRRWQAAVSALFLAGGFTAGVVAERLDAEPATSLRAILSAGKAMLAVLGHEAGIVPVASVGDRPVPAQTGAHIFDAGAMAPGLTLLATGPSIDLRQPDGQKIFHWRVPLDRLFTLPALLDPADVETSGLDLRPDGAMLALVQYERDFPAFHWQGTAMNTVLVKIDRDSRLLWSFTGNPHHDLRVGPDGTIYVLVAREGMTPPRPDLALPPHFRDEGVAVLDADGHEQRTIWFAEAIAGSPYANLFAALDPGWAGCLPDQRYCWNLFHANSVQVISPAIASRLPFVSAGDLLINLRELDAVLVLDPANGKLRWAMRGAWRHAHDAAFTPSGTLMLFDNRGNYGEGEPSRILELDPVRGDILWSYSGGTQHPFSSSVHGTQQLLTNGNVLITETMGGRMFEVTRGGAVAWEYDIAPSPGLPFAPEIWGGRRIDPADYPFLAACTAPPCGIAG